MNFDPIRPYLPIVGLLLAVVMLFGGCSWGKSIQRGATADKVASLKQSLVDAQTSLKAAAKALRAQSADNRFRIADAAATAKLAGKAEGLAAAMEVKGDKAVEAYARGLRDASRKSPDCEALLSSDILKVCGL